jgi:hypothetical protein
MAPQVSQELATAVTPSQVKLYPYIEEKPVIWFHHIEAKSAVVGIRSQKLKYTNTHASLPKQVLWDIFDTVDTCQKSHHPSDDLKAVLLGQFGKRKCQSYFELLRLPLGMDSILMDKLKQLLPHRVSSDINLLNSIFLIRLPPSMREMVGAGNHKMAAAMVEASDAW